MQSLKQLYKVGPGPSSSHTMGPQLAAQKFKDAYPDAKRMEVVLHGSLSLTGKGHLTDYIIEKTINDIPLSIFWEDQELEKHPNGMILRAFDQNDDLIDEWVVYSVGGGSIKIDGHDNEQPQEVYPEKNLDEIYNYLNENNMEIIDYIIEKEGVDILDYLEFIVDSFVENTNRGLKAEGVLPGEPQMMERVAKRLYEKALVQDDPNLAQKYKTLAYAYAIGEENASGGQVVTAPTCGSAGVMPALVMTYFDKGYSKEEIIKAVGVAGVFGNLIKRNATISGAEGGCQAEIGSACSMAAAAAAYLEGLNLRQIEYAAEVAMEHHLGLTCDPVKGYVLVPCIERNTQAVLRAIDAMELAKALGDIRINSVSFDTIIRTMKETGMDLKQEYRETALGGLAINFYVDNKLRK